jgi:hypothetical protein
LQFSVPDKTFGNIDLKIKIPATYQQFYSGACFYTVVPPNVQHTVNLFNNFNEKCFLNYGDGTCMKMNNPNQGSSRTCTFAGDKYLLPFVSLLSYFALLIDLDDCRREIRWLKIAE